MTGVQWSRWGVRFTAAAPVQTKAFSGGARPERAPGGDWQARGWRGRWVRMGGRVQLAGRARRGTVTGVPSATRVTVSWDDGLSSTVPAYMVRPLPSDSPAAAGRQPGRRGAGRLPGPSAGGGPEGAGGEPPEPPRPKVRDLIPVRGEPWDSDAATEGLRWLLEGRDFAGYQIEIAIMNDGAPKDGGTYVHWTAGVMKDGEPVGTMMRRWDRHPDGTVTAWNDVLELEPEHRGKGFAPAISAYLEQLYIESGFERVDVYASSEDGGYTWASAGFGFLNDYEAEARLEALQAEQEALIRERDSWAGPKDDPRYERIVSEITAAEQLLQRWQRFEFGDPGFPTAREISQTGRRPGETIRDHTWIGARAMRGSDWEGVKWLR
ncbi:GNAT family N-acetyltransferase [Nonomuraea sp. NPDC005650]|uniref:GNAT family N-acetyltransferase n=1 Tax=Nonomuraea sp. NPDC005650 TaxID=3157045 RepID=UPI0033BD0544